ncbi:MAG TPA: tetratricopeptide repeat protein [Archangium sp.]|uniref:tetratricopeptide repeat protein n=1 Tax=Archangium sp. TaxID=1872627 RepID=UPI002E36F9FC|nr:tetratricopeptide repeat protein [Archangium sp.]HEX5748982.1 tetratricopeptide repeat protein [Archangium sp.]
MQRKLQELQETLRNFVDQRDFLILVVSAHDDEMAWVLKTLQGLDEEMDADLFLVCNQEAGPVAQYATAVNAGVAAQIEVANTARKAKGEPRWAPLPAQGQDTRLPPAERLRSAMIHIRSLMPAEEDHRLVWCLLPPKLKDRAGFAQLVSQLLPLKGYEPWMRSLRIIVRDDRAEPFLGPTLNKLKAPGVLLYEVDFSTGALTDGLAQDAVDESRPVAQRMQALVQLAALDYAHRRYPQALEKYGLLHDYYAEHGAKEMQALCLQGAGDVLRQLGKPEKALERYQQGLALAIQTKALPVLLNLAMAAGDVCLELKQYPDAEGYFDITDQVAAKALNAHAKADALEKLGRAREGRTNTGGALRAWRDTATLCRSVGYPERLRSVLEHMARLYENAGMRQERQQCLTELRTLSSREEAR